MGTMETLQVYRKIKIIADEYIYWAVNLGAISIPFLFSFHPRLRFDREWKYALPAIFLVAMLFVIWDSYFTSLGIWGFNDRYLAGGELLGLPLEEIAFFICIPYACLFSYHLFQVILRGKIK